MTHFLIAGGHARPYLKKQMLWFPKSHLLKNQALRLVTFWPWCVTRKNLTPRPLNTHRAKALDVVP
jgi:hypothetical protein